MWVRKQNKEALVNCNEFRIVEGACLLKGKYTIQSDGYILGIYDSKEKALKVLDEIQNSIMSGCYDGVYQMPQDKEVK